MGTDTALKLVGLVLNVFGLPTGLFSKIKDTISLVKEIEKEKQLSEKEKFIQELTETATRITSNENCPDDVIENIVATLSDSERFSSKKILEHFYDVEDYSAELTISRYGNNYANDPSAEGYKSAMEQLLSLIYKKLQVLGVASNSEEAILIKLFSYETLLEENHAILFELKYRGTFATWLDGQELPAPVEGNIFNYCNPQIGFYGRDKEIEELKAFVNKLGVSVWGIAGLGGSGKSKLAREFAKMEKPNLKTVWLKAEHFDELLHDNFNNDYSYPLPVLFICDYAAQYEDKLKNLIEKFCSHPSTRAKFLLLERQSNWYVSFVKNNDRIYDLAIKDKVELKSPIDLTSTELDDKACKAIIKDLSISKDIEGQPRYPDANLQDNEYAKIIARAKELSEDKTSVRCLFMLLLTDVLLRGDDIQEMDSAALMKNYIKHSKEILHSNYQSIVDEGFRLLAYATACGGIKLNELRSHEVVKKEWEAIRTHLGNSKKEIISLFNQLSESDEKDMLAALKPDLIGEFLFLNEWNDIVEGQEEWLNKLLKENESRTFLARCLTDWKTESEQLCEMLSDINADEEQRIQCAMALNSAVYEGHTVSEQMAFLKKIKELDCDYSILILSEYINAIRFIFDYSQFDIRTKYIISLNATKYEKYLCKNEDEKVLLIYAFNDIASLNQAMGNYDDALKFLNQALTFAEKELEKFHPAIATTYNNYALFNRIIGKYDDALEYYQKSIEIKEKVYGKNNYQTAMTYNNIAVVFSYLHNSKEALFFFDKTLKILKQFLSVNHPYIAVVYNNIAKIHHDNCNYNKALTLYKDALKIFEDGLGYEHHDTAMTYSNMSAIYKDMGNYDKAFEYAYKAECLFEKILGTEHPNTKKVYVLLFKLYGKNKNFEKAKEYAKKAGIIPTPSSQP